MEIYVMKRKINTAIEGLSPRKLKIVFDFITDLQWNDKDETQTLLKEPGFIEAYRQAKNDQHSGNIIKWEDIKRDV
jgi:hypothetical protein